MTDARDDSPVDTATDGLLPAGFSHRRQRIEAVDGPLTLPIPSVAKGRRSCCCTAIPKRG